LAENRKGDILTLRQISKNGEFRNTKRKLNVAENRNALSPYRKIEGCTLYQRVKFNKVEVDKIAFEDFVHFLNGEMVNILRTKIKEKDTDEVLRTVGRVVFSVFHLTKKQGETFNIDDVLDKVTRKLMQTAVKKSMVQYLQERYTQFKGDELDERQILMEMELAKIVFSFSENHQPIRKAASRYMSLVRTNMTERFLNEPDFIRKKL